MVLGVQRKPILASAVLAIVSPSPEEQMIGVDAGRIVALVKNIDSFRYRTLVNFVRDTMRSLGAAVQPKQPIFKPGIDTAESSPFPASRWHLFNLGQKSILERDGFGLGLGVTKTSGLPRLLVMAPAQAAANDLLAIAFAAFHGITVRTFTTKCKGKGSMCHTL